MKVKFLESVAFCSPDLERAFAAGETADIPDEFAQDSIKAGLAEPYTEGKAK